ncbi:MAG TPA: nitroreductase family protein [Candidatus Tectomicrobia bacterium]|nr:nitroreductase family protein [Candidatus Tectomicrobia bacterium]
MDKEADTIYPIETLLKRRWSPRAFSARPVEPEKLLSLWEAARWAASCANEQPWYFIVATKQNETEYARLLSCLRENNQQWAQQAPVLMVSVAKLAFDANGQANRYAFHDVGLAVANLITQATTLGLFVHQMAGFYPDKVRELYGVPEGFEPVAGIVLGYPGDPASLPEDLKQRELARRARRPIETFVFECAWGHISPLVTLTPR